MLSSRHQLYRLTADTAVHSLHTYANMKLTIRNFLTNLEKLLFLEKKQKFSYDQQRFIFNNVTDFWNHLGHLADR